MSSSKSVPESSNPYLAARLEWNERYGSFIQQANMWRGFAFGSLLIAVIAVGGSLYQASKSKLIPYVIEVDKLGTTVGVKRADEAKQADHRVVRAALAAFVQNTRMVSPDGYLQKAALLNAYAYLSNADPSTAALNEFFSKNSPFERAQTETVTVEINTALPLTKDSWQIEWTETVRTRKGAVKEVSRWKAVSSIYLAAPTTEAAMLKNPLGVFIKDYSWTKQM